MNELKIQFLNELSAWLEINYRTVESIWLVFPKKTAGANFAWSEIVDVLLCYGWIDSTGRKVDEKFNSLRISPRNPKSNWSRINKEKITRLQQQNLMHENGLKMVEIAKKTGTWTALNDVENLILPEDFEKFLLVNNLLDAWNQKTKSFKRGFLEQLLNTKTEITRQKKFVNLIL